MTTQLNVMKQALEALDNLLYWDNGKPEYDEAREAITAIKQALNDATHLDETSSLAAPVQEPVAQGCTHPNLGCGSLRDDGSPARWGCVMCGKEFVPKPAAQPAPVQEPEKFDPNDSFERNEAAQNIVREFMRNH